VPDLAETATPAAARRPAGRPPGKVIVVLPAMNAASTLRQTVASIPRDWVDEVILVDDHSSDETVELARKLPLHLVWHPHNAGYGANQKTCYLEALQRGADAVVMLHPHGQYEPSLIPRMVEPILIGRADLVLGSRFAEPGMALKNGMPRWKYVANRALTITENWVIGTNLSEAHTGYRAYSRKLLLTVPFLRNSLDFVFDSELIMQAAYFNLRIEEVPAACARRQAENAAALTETASDSPRPLP
jgi:glycosyltransferase involved in cell wall biosynthesis